MTARDIESRIALAMLPLGAVLTLISAVALIGAIGLAGMLLWRWPADAGWWLTWTAAVAIAALYVLRKGIETMSTFDWRTAIAPLVVGAAVASACPCWWL